MNKKGLCARELNSNKDDLVQLIKFTLFPSPFPQKWFTFAKSIQENVNLLYHRIAYNDDFLIQSLKEVIEIDDFISKLYNIYLKVKDEKKAQKISLGIFRSDYMLNNQPQQLKQIEINTISVSCKGMVTILNDLHRYILSQNLPSLLANLPDSQSNQDLANGLIKAWELYDVKDAIILFVSEDQVNTICDQKSIQIAINEVRPNVKVLRQSFAQLTSTLKINQEHQIFVNKYEVAVVYYRTGYSPKNYSHSSYWKVRESLELSKAIKCPSIRYHLAGVKMIQQILTNYDQLKRFLSKKEQLNEIFSTFAKIYRLRDDEEGNFAFKLGLNNPQKYVLKPQREGGANNYFGKDMVDKLNEIKKSKERNSYILMELIQPAPVYNCIVTPNITLQNKKKQKIVCELGIFGIILGDAVKVYYNCESGYLLRSKDITATEGCVSLGLGSIDSPLLI